MAYSPMALVTQVIKLGSPNINNLRKDYKLFFCVNFVCAY